MLTYEIAERKTLDLKILAISPEQFDPARHRLPVAGELLLPGVQVEIRADGVAFALKQALMRGYAYGTVIELSRQGEGVEVALSAQRQEDGGYFFEAFWVLVG
ncbi:MAG: hypothetical protein OXG60_14440 [Chloroflexi bacterium]|nr:hypothetical protein [Chloroflexota bacterium]